VSEQTRQTRGQFMRRFVRPADPHSEHRLEFLDQTALELHRVTGRGQLMQCVWVYDHPVNEEGLQRFHHNLYESLGGRLIERSPLPFGRARWVRPVCAPAPIHRAVNSRPRSELMDWADELGSLPIDPEKGPGWQLAVLPLDGGSTAISIVASHVIGDGAGALMAVFEAVTGNIRNMGYEQRGSRPKSRVVLADLGRAVRDLPLSARTTVTAVKMLRDKRKDFARARAAQSHTSDGDYVIVPSAAFQVDIADWDARAEALGGNSYSLLAGFAAKLSEYLDRRRADGDVSLLIAINTRESLDDDRALAMAFATAHVDPTKVTVDLTESRAAVREARQKAKDEADPTRELLPLVPWLPKKTVKGIVDLMFSYSEDLPVSCSNLGDLPAELSRLDGTPAESVFIRALDTNVTTGELQRSHGQLVVVSGRINGKVSVSVEAYQLGGENTKARLRAIVAQTLEEFELTGVVD